MVIYRAVFVRYLQQLPERDARLRAYAEVRGYIGKGNSSGVRLLSVGSGQTGQSGQEVNGQNGHIPNRQNGTVKQGIRAFLDEHPGLDQQSINEVLSVLKEAGVQAGRTSVSEVLAERKERVTSNAT